jgi:hypothetical protein
MGKRKPKRDRALTQHVETIEDIRERAKQRERQHTEQSESDDEQPSWSFTKISTLSFFPFPLDDHENLREILKSLRDLEGQSIAGLKNALTKTGKSSSFILTEYHIDECRDKLCPKVVDHLDRFLPGSEYLSRFRLGSKKRLYAVQRGSKFLLLWWDSEHRVYGCKQMNENCEAKCQFTK